ncbi:MAG: threonine ammonia-lyase [Roseiflexaceae bacterium]
MQITLTDIQAAHAALRDVIIETPIVPDDTLSTQLGVRVFHKAESLQRSGSFKVRGAYNAIRALSDAERARGVVTNSAGNHAQGVALAAQLYQVPATIVMPEHAPLTKVTATRAYGAEVVLSGATFDDAGIEARRIQAERNLTFIHAFNDRNVITGQATIGLELMAQLARATVVVVPIGGGGLISGIATALHALGSPARVIGVQAAGCDAVRPSLAAGHPVRVDAVRTIADGIAVKQPGDITLAIIKARVHTVVTIDDEQIAAAITHAARALHLVVEGAGAAGLAALLAGVVPLQPDDVVCNVLCGGNIDPNFLTRVIEQVLVKQGRYLMLRVLVADRPGNLAPLLRVVAESGANVIDIFHRRATWLVPIDRVGIELILEVRDNVHGTSVVDTLQQHGYVVTQEGMWK